MSGTDLVYDTTRLRACYAMSGAELGYGATRISQRRTCCRSFRRICLPCYVLAMQCPVLTSGIALQAIRERESELHEVSSVLATSYALAMR
eukprot:3177848-Rhodomonas_salina.7